mmetsp:Transcript_44532/g.127637  ORF Transcript_44532/g.127637 Transcript_44532/m.127637 type:complete len:1194 (+) Transcript_44532:58-3639(+)
MGLLPSVPTLSTPCTPLPCSGAFAVLVPDIAGPSRTLQRVCCSGEAGLLQAEHSSGGFVVMCSVPLLLLTAARRRGLATRRSPPLLAAKTAFSTEGPMKLIMVDASGILHRAYHALEKVEMRNQRGEPVGALSTFLKTLLRLDKDIPGATHIIIAMDASRSALLRRELFPKYKARRLETDEDLRMQLSKAQEACQAFGWETRAKIGYEADDLIHTYTQAALNASPDASVHIVSADKDLMQLVGPRVWVHNDPKQPSLAMDEASAEEIWQVKPCQIADLLALMGDTSDNLPGVPLIGRKRAIVLLQKCKTLQGVLEAAKDGSLDEEKGVGKNAVQKLVENEELALKMRKLVGLWDVDLPDADAETLQATFRIPQRDGAWGKRAIAFCRHQGLQAFEQQILTMSGTLYLPDSAGVQSSLPLPGGQRPASSAAAAQLPSSSFVLPVRNKTAAKEAMKKLKEHRDGAVFAVSLECDARGTETWPSCLSIYGGGEEGLDFGGGASCLWVDLVGDYGERAHAVGMLECFKMFFKDVKYNKVYHCFADVRRLLFPDFVDFEEVDLRHSCPHGDTMHMARLWNPSLYSYDLDKLSNHHLLTSSSRSSLEDQEEAAACKDWPELCGRKAKAMFELHRVLLGRLREQVWMVVAGGADLEPSSSGSTMLEFYEQCWRPFGKLLSDVEIVGINIDRRRLEALTKEAEDKQRELDAHFLSWAKMRTAEQRGEEAVKDANLDMLNLNASRQLLQLFCGSGAEPMEFEFRFDGAAEEPSSEAAALPPEEELEGMKLAELKALCLERKLKVTGKKVDLVQRLLNPSESDSAKVPKVRATMRIYGLGIESLKDFTTKSKGELQLTREMLIALKNERQEPLREDGVKAVDALLQRRDVEKILQFLRSIEEWSTSGRIRASFNLNTETGRLSSRNPNLQQIPTGVAIPVREAFTAKAGNTLIIADYSQLELRVVAHLATCTPMIEVLSTGGDIHSSTAYKMFDDVRTAVDEGQVELDRSSDSELPLVKDKFPEFRKRAKTLNFALLYGKTAHGLAKEWKMPKQEAQQIIDKWFDAFPEIRDWDKAVRADAQNGVFARTVMGRIRPVEGTAASASPKKKAYSLRQAVNSPVQGSAADIVTMAMLKVDESKTLKKMGFRQVLQVHDEIILEGPSEVAEEALTEVLRIMEDPLPFPFKVPLRVDARIADTWRHHE